MGDQAVYKEMNRMLILSMVELFSDEDFRNAHNLNNNRRLYIMEAICNSDHPSAKRIVARLSKKADDRLKKNGGKKPPKQGDKVLNELNERQVAQTYRTALSINAFCQVDRRIREAFDITFRVRKRPISLITAGSYIQSVIHKEKPTATTNPLSTDVPSVFEVLLWFHTINTVMDEVKNKRTTCKCSYITGNVLGFIVSKVFRAWRSLLQRLHIQSPMRAFAPYLWFDTTTGTFRHVPRDEGFSPLSQLEQFQPQVLPTATGAGACDTATKRSDGEDKAFRHLTYALLKKLKDIACNNTVHSSPIDQVSDFPDIRALADAHGGRLTYVYAEVDDHVFDTLQLSKPVPYPLEVYNIDDSSTHQVGQVSLISSKPMDKSLCYRLPSSRIRGKLGRRRLSLTREPSGRPKKRQKTIQQTLSTKSTPTEVKEEDVVMIDKEQTVQFTEDTIQQSQPYKILREELRKYVSVYKADFDDVAEEHEDLTGSSMNETVDLVLTDPPYNTRREQQRPNSSHDELSTKDMEHFVDVCDSVLLPGGQIIVFCSFIQFPTWLNVFKSLTGKTTEKDEDEEGISRVVEDMIFSVEPTPLKFTRARGFYNRTPAARSVAHLSMTEIALHAWKKGASQTEILKRLDYNAPAYVPTSLPGWTDTIDNIPRLPANEAIFLPGTGTTKPQMLRPEQKNVSWMKTIVNKYCPGGGTVLDTFAGTLAVAKACISLPQHRKCIACDRDKDCIDISMPSLVVTFAEQLLSDKSDITGSAEVQYAACTFLKMMRSARSATSLSNWSAPPGLSPMQYLPEHILLYISAYYSDYSLYRTYKKVSYMKWTSSWRQRFNEMETQQLLAHELAYLGLQLRQSSIPGAGQGILTARPFGQDEVIGWFYGALIYDNIGIGKDKDSADLVGEGILAVPVKEFNKWVVQLKHKARINNSNHPGDETDVWIYPVPFCAMRYINDGRRQPPNATDNTIPPEDPAANNVKWVLPATRPTNVAFQEPDHVSIVAKTNIPRNTELFINYGESFHFDV